MTKARREIDPGTGIPIGDRLKFWFWLAVLVLMSLGIFLAALAWMSRAAA